MTYQYPIYSNGYRVIRMYDKEFVRIFFHDTSHKQFFKNEEEALFSQEKYKQSVLKYVTPEFTVDDNKYEFILQYPELDVNIHWTQETSILEKTLDTKHELLDDSDEASRFGGLAVSYDSNYTLLDGIVSDYTPDWWYCIGAYLPELDANNQIPGPYIGSVSTTVNKVALYIRINNIMLIETFPPYRIKCPTLHLGIRNSISYSFILLLSITIFHSS